MRFAMLLPTDRVDAGGEFIGAAPIAAMARAAEQAGFDAVSVTDHPFPPARWVATGGHHALDPFVALSFAAAATTRLQLLTQVIVLPYRNPFLVAKSAASLDVLSNGRLILGVAAGYLEAEFAAVGADFAHRNEIADDAIDAIRAAWSGDAIDRTGRGYRAAGNAQLPRPAHRDSPPSHHRDSPPSHHRDSPPSHHRDSPPSHQAGGPPIWVGGNSRRAIRRAVERAQGWHPFPAAAKLARRAGTAAMESLDDLRDGLAFAREHAAKIGRSEPLDVCLVPFGFTVGAREPVEPARFRDEIARYAEAGVTWLALTLPAPSRAAWCDLVAALGDAIAAR